MKDGDAVAATSAHTASHAVYPYTNRTPKRVFAGYRDRKTALLRRKVRCFGADGQRVAERVGGTGLWRGVEFRPHFTTHFPPHK